MDGVIQACPRQKKGSVIVVSLALMSSEQKARFFERLDHFGCTPHQIQVLLSDDQLMGHWVGQLGDHPAFSLVHGVFRQHDRVLAAFQARCAENGIDFGKFSWIGPMEAPAFDPEDREAAVVLEATLGTLRNTFEFAWTWAADGQPRRWRREEFDSPAAKIRLLSDERPDDAEGEGPGFEPWTIRWVRIKLDANVGKDLKNSDVRNHAISPGCALLFLAAEHPERIRATDYVKRFGFYLSGLKCAIPGEHPWASVAYLYFESSTQTLELHACLPGDAGPYTAAPIFCK